MLLGFARTHTHERAHTHPQAHAHQSEVGIWKGMWRREHSELKEKKGEPRLGCASYTLGFCGKVRCRTLQQGEDVNQITLVH